MGAHPWFYLVPYQNDVRRAMLELRDREFRAGRYNPVMPFPHMHADEAPGAEHDSIDAAREDAAEDGTRSILDMEDVADEPADPDGDPPFCVVSPLPPELLEELYGTTQPTREMVEDLAFLEDIERGTGVYLVVYANGRPSEICFAGYSFD